MKGLNVLRYALLPPPAAIISVALIVLLMMPFGGSANFDVSQKSSSNFAFSSNASEKNSIGLPLPRHNDAGLVEITQRPLFLKDRKAWEEVVIFADPIIQEPSTGPKAVVPVFEVGPPPLPKIALLGITRNGDSVRALISDFDGGNERWIQVNSRIAEWLVVEIENGQVVLRAEGEEVIVSFNR